MINYVVLKIPTAFAKEYIIKNHYAHGCTSCPSACYGLLDGLNLIGVLMFACPCSENVRASVFGVEHKHRVIELHRLHILDVTPKNTESWFISKCLKLLQQDKPEIKGVLSFSDSSEGHEGIIYQATNAYRCGSTGSAIFYRDKQGRLRHPRQHGVNITLDAAKEKGWAPERRGVKNRYLYIIGNKREKKFFKKICKIINTGDKNVNKW